MPMVHAEHQISLTSSCAISVHEWLPENAPDDCQTIIALHGFTGDALAFEPLVQNCTLPLRWIALNYLGSDPQPISLETCLCNIKAVIEYFKLTRVHLLGYSMGGRIALHFAIKYTELLANLILISASPGIIEEKERVARLEQDRALAQKALTEGTKTFIDFWQSTPLIATQKKYIPENIYSALLKRCYGLDKHGIANALINLSPAKLPALWNRLREIKVPTLLLTGAEDSKYISILSKVKETLSEAELEVIPKSGHAPHLENAPACGKVIQSFLSAKASSSNHCCL